MDQKTESSTTNSSSFKTIFPQFLAILVLSIVLLQWGIVIGYSTILIPNISGDKPDQHFSLNETQISWISSINYICVPFGCIFSGYATHKVGRKKAMQAINIPIFASWMLLAFSTKIWHLYLALCLSGLAGGLMEAPVVTYVAEVTQPHARGVLSAMVSIAATLGIFFAFLLGSFLTWRTVALVASLVNVVSVTALFFVPESPTWLIVRNRFEEAHRALAWLRGWTSKDAVKCEFQDLCKSRGVQSQSSFADSLALVATPGFLRPYLLVSFSFFVHHFGGVNTLMTFSVPIFQRLNSPIDEYLATVLFGISAVIGTVICLALVHYTGKRILLLLSSVGCSLCFFVVAAYAYTTNVHHIFVDADVVPVHHNYSWIPVTFSIAASFIANIGIRVIPWILIGEVFSVQTNNVGSGMAAATAYMVGFTVNRTYLMLDSTLTFAGTFVLYGLIGVVGGAVLYAVLPETEGKSLEEITEYFTRKEKLCDRNGSRNRIV